MKFKFNFRVPVALKSTGTLLHRPVKGKGSYIRKPKHCKRNFTKGFE
jgi:hypothetical protein